MTTPQQVLDIARSQLGTTDSGNNHTKYGAWYGADGQAWCAMFVSWVFDQAGLRLPATTAKGFAYCPYGVSWFKGQGRFLTSGPVVGDVVFYSWAHNGVADHVGIVESLVPKGVIAIEGNTSVSNNTNGDSVMRRSRTVPVILGYGRPAYTKQVTTTPPEPISFGTVRTFGDDMQSKPIHIPHLDKDGNGWVDTGVPIEKFNTCNIFGPSPDRDSYAWANIYWSVNNTNGQARLEFEGGTDGQPLDIVVWSVN